MMIYHFFLFGRIDWIDGNQLGGLKDDCAQEEHV